MKTLILISSLWLLISCSKNVQIAQPFLYQYKYYGPNLTKTSVEKIKPDYYKNLQPRVQRFQIYSDTLLRGHNGTQLTIVLSCFGQAKDLEVELTEIFSKKDMILSNRPTISNGKILESDGELHIRITHQGKEIQPLCAQGLTIQLPTQRKENFLLFSGSTLANGTFNWEVDTGCFSMQNNILETEYSSDSPFSEFNDSSPSQVIGAENYLFQAQKLGWINCDRFYEDSTAKTDLEVMLENEMPAPYFHRVYAVFDSINSVIPLYSGDNKKFTASGIPQGSKITIIALGATDTKTFLSKKNILVTEHSKTNLRLEAMSKTEIEKLLDEM
jgi:outer membrane protein assembly factor BamB